VNITRNASPRPSTVNEEARTVELTIATESDVGDGVVLSCRQLPEFGPAPVPVLLSHQNTATAMAGRIRSLRIENRQVVGVAEFSDAPAAAEGWALARAGCAVSVGASIDPSALQRQRNGPDLAGKWRLNEASLVPVGADPHALTRSSQSLVPMTTDTTTAAAADSIDSDGDEIQLSRAELKRQRDVLRLAADAKLTPEQSDALLTSGRSIQECSRQAIAWIRERTEGHLSPIGHPAQGDWFTVTGAGVPPARSSGNGEPADPLGRALYRAMRGQSLDRSLVDELKAAGYAGRSGEELARNAFALGKRNQLLRGFHSTSDAKELLMESGERLLQERHQEAPRGILELARPRTLADFREASTIDAGLVGGAVQLNEGAEIKYGSLNSEAGKYKPVRYGLGLSFTYEALASDDLGGIAQVMDEVSATMLEAEAARLGELLHGTGALGGICPDGLELFHADHGNKLSSPGTLSVQGLGDMVELLRKQTSVGGRKIWLQPGYVLVGPDLETTAMQLMAESWSATAPDDTNPWKNLRLIIDPTVEPTYFYLVASGSRKPFELGRVDGLPTMKQEEDFNTSGMKMKVEHAFGAACIDHRVIVRNK
jgi:hypothetical protein